MSYMILSVSINQEYQGKEKLHDLMLILRKRFIKKKMAHVNEIPRKTPYLG